MKIDKDTIKYIANLAMIEILPYEEEKYSKDLEQILTYVEILDKMDLSKLTELSDTIDKSNQTGKDEVERPMDRELIESNAPEMRDGTFRVPRVLE